MLTIGSVASPDLFNSAPDHQVSKALVSNNGGFLLLELEVWVLKLSEVQLACLELQHIF